MDNTNYNAKCLKCGYIFETNENGEKAVCPLCGEENDLNKSMESFKEKFKDYKPAKKKTTLRMILDLVVFGLSLCALIIVLFFVVTLIVTLVNQ